MMSDGYFLGVDVGSASVRAGLYSAQGERLSFATRPISQFHASNARVEQSSAEIWQQVCAVVREAVDSSGISPDAICSIGFDATCSLVALDAEGNGLSVSPDSPASQDIIMWMDHRAHEETVRINATRDPALCYVGGEVSIEMELPKLLWLQRHHPETWNQAWRFFDLADFLVWKATGQDAASLCTLTCKWNYLAHEAQFSESLLREVGLETLLTKIPDTILDVAECVGKLSPQAAQALGLPEEVVVASGMIDAHAGGVALTGSHPEGTLALISGTSNCHMLASQTEIHTPGVWGPYWSAMLPGYWLTEGGQSAAGALVDWTLREHGASADLFAKAEAAQRHPVALLNDWVAALEQEEKYPTRNLHILADHHGNRSPRSRPDARGSVVGLTLETGERALARLYLATLQAIAYGTRHIMDTLKHHGHTLSRIVICGGTTHNRLWLREYADATGCDIHLLAEEDAVTLGAAICGAVASGAWATLTDATREMVKAGDIITRRPETAAFHRQKYEAYLMLWTQQQALNLLMQQEM